MNSASVGPRVAIFDSGVGGLSILAHAQQLLPHCRFDYISDNGGFPYGDKPDEVVIERTCQVLARYFARAPYPADIVVIACNTASTLALPALRAIYSLPVIGVVPAIKPAASASANGYFGLLATPATIRRAYTRQLIDDFANHCHVVCVGSSALVAMAEAQLRGEPVDTAQLAHELLPFTVESASNPYPQRLDCLVLACTHFPLLQQPIQALLGPQVRLLDSGEAIARRIAFWQDNGVTAGTPAVQVDSPATAWFSAPSGNPESLRPALARFALNNVDYL
ncbi:MAG TPA: glutamate racemase [Cellvibrionaceae bacterium]